MTNLIYLNQTQLRLHPRNMRLYYPDEDVAEMAESIKAAKGVYQALLVVPTGPKSDEYWVVDGNMRLAGARLLGNACPPLKCEVVSYDAAEQLLTMAATSKFHYPKDPISEAKHYQRLIDEEGFSVRDIHHQTGIAEATISGLLGWLELEEEIQALVGQRKLQKSARVAEALKLIPNSEARVKLAKKFASNGTKIKQIERDCERMVELLAAPVATVSPKAKPMVSKATLRYVPPRSRYRFNYESATAVMELAEELCGPCSVKGLKEGCASCPGVVEFVQRIIGLAEQSIDADQVRELAA